MKVWTDAEAMAWILGRAGHGAWSGFTIQTKGGGTRAWHNEVFQWEIQVWLQGLQHNDIDEYPACGFVIESPGADFYDDLHWTWQDVCGELGDRRALRVDGGTVWDATALLRSFIAAAGEIFALGYNDRASVIDWVGDHLDRDGRRENTPFPAVADTQGHNVSRFFTGAV